MFLEQDFPDTHGFWGNFHHFVNLDIFKGLLKGEFYHRGHTDRFIFSGSTEVGHLFGFHYVDPKVIIAGIFPDNLAFINIFEGLNKETSPVGKFVDRISSSHPGFNGNEHAGQSLRQCAFPWLKCLETMGYDSLAGSGRHNCIS